MSKTTNKRWTAARKARDPEGWAAWQAGTFARNQEHAWRSRYGIGRAGYEGLLKRQGGHCGMCPATRGGPSREFLYVDHCHDCGRVRGLLCHRCNLAVRWYEDGLYASAREYLRHWNDKPYRCELADGQD